MKKLNLQELINYCKEYGFIFQSSEIYDGMQAIYDYGYYGCLLKQNIKSSWWKEMVQLNNNIVGIDASIIMHPTVWAASGHIASFDDLMIDNKDSKKRYRVDVLIEDFANKNNNTSLITDLNKCIQTENLEGLYKIIVDNNICCPVSGTCNWTKVRHFNLMFQSKDIDDNIIYLRPETAQGIYVNFLNLQRSTHQKIPFGIAQIGKAFRNEIIARQFTFRMREFEQMEMQFFIKPDEEERIKYYDYWKKKRMEWYVDVLNIPSEKLRFKEHDHLAHYAKEAVDIEYEFPFGFKEIEGIHCRGDYDLSNHGKYSKKNMNVIDTVTNGKYIPHVIETSCGCDRIALMMLAEFILKDDNVQNDNRLLFSVPANFAPIKYAVLPLMKKTELTTVAKKIYDHFKIAHMCVYDDVGSIGKRYVRNDIIGTVKCITVDYQTLEDNTVTIRERDSMKQVRVNIETIIKNIENNTQDNR